MQKGHAKFGVGIACTIAILIATYLAIGFYYQDGFSLGTFINGIYCTGMSVEEVNAKLCASYEYPGFTVTFTDGSSQQISFEEVGGSVDYTDALTKIQKKQNPLTWIMNFASIGSNSSKLLPTISVDEAAFQTTFDLLDQVESERKNTRQVVLNLTEDGGYILVNTKAGALNVTEACEAALAAFRNGESNVNLEMAGCYHDLEMTEEETATLNLYEEIAAFLNFEISVDLGDCVEVIDHPELSFLLMTDTDVFDLVRDETGSFVWNEEAIASFAEEFAEKYSTYGSARAFETSTGETLTIEGGTYGNEIDAKALKAFLLEAIPARQSLSYIPEYTREAYVRGVKDITEDYIEIDLTNQTLYFYIDGKQVLTTPVVTGDMMRNRETPTGVYYVYGKQKNRTLRGPNYAAHVNYWMPIIRGIGIHDALWRDEFGGDIYETNGSHGCINTPLEAMEIMYEQTEVGMPVILFNTLKD